MYNIYIPCHVIYSNIPFKKQNRQVSPRFSQSHPLIHSSTPNTSTQMSTCPLIPSTPPLQTPKNRRKKKVFIEAKPCSPAKRRRWIQRHPVLWTKAAQCWTPDASFVRHIRIDATHSTRDATPGSRRPAALGVWSRMGQGKWPSALKQFLKALEIRGGESHVNANLFTLPSSLVLQYTSQISVRSPVHSLIVTQTTAQGGFDPGWGALSTESLLTGPNAVHNPNSRL